jgi:hypothetical protein
MNKSDLHPTDRSPGRPIMILPGLEVCLSSFILSRSANQFLLHLAMSSARLTAQLDC